MDEELTTFLHIKIAALLKAAEKGYLDTLTMQLHDADWWVILRIDCTLSAGVLSCFRHSVLCTMLFQLVN